MTLHQRTGEPELRRVAAEALAFERSLFDEALPGWPDRRPRPRIEDYNGASPAAWCSGAAGIGLARCRIFGMLRDPIVAEEIRAAVKFTVENGFGFNHSLCHGDFGNRELLHEAASALDDPALYELSEQITAKMVAEVRTSGYRTGIRLGVDSVDLMRGSRRHWFPGF